jgi:excisionase family DNA binding protein
MSEARPTVTREALSMSDAAKLLDVHYETVRRLVAAGELESFRVGRVVRIKRCVIASFAVKQRDQVNVPERL